MLANVGHTIQKIINNIPIAISVNETTTSVVTNGGNVYQSGLVSNKIQYSFQEIFTNEDIVGRVIDVQSTENKVYFLSAGGSVFEYDYNLGTCSPVVREVYSPAICGGDKAVRIVSGRAHLLILTECNKIWGVGCNENYQLVPQGQCRYDIAVELIITDTNMHDNNSCETFAGCINELRCPVIPQCPETSCNVSCVKDFVVCKQIGTLSIPHVVLDSEHTSHTLELTVLANYKFVSFLCVDRKCVSGTFTYTLEKVFIKAGCQCALFNNTSIQIAVSNELILAEFLTGTTNIQGECGEHVAVTVSSVGVGIPSVASGPGGVGIVLTLLETATVTGINTTISLASGESHTATLSELQICVPLKCCPPQRVCHVPEVQLPQPCWMNVYAGFNISVFVDNCNRLYVLGSLHEIRKNRNLLQRSCLEDLLNRASASVSFPADQLNCCVKPKNDNCKCTKCVQNCFKTDLNKFGINLNFGQGDPCDANNLNVCDFLKALKRCNEAPICDNTCEPCDSYIYLNVCGGCFCHFESPTIGSVTLYNRRSICKLVSQGCLDPLIAHVTERSLVEFDFNRYCVDGEDFCLDKVIILDFCTEGPNVNLYIDLDKPGGIQFFYDAQPTVEFTADASNETHQYILNYGSILDPVELTNLKCALCINPCYPCPRFKNPFDTKIVNTYLRGGDRVRFFKHCSNGSVRQAITADVPTIFRLNRRVLDVGVGYNNISVLVGGLACPNEIFALGNNCNGELGINSNVTVVCFAQVNRCLFDCQVKSIFSARHVTFYLTQSNRVYGSGQWKCLVNSNTPEHIESIKQSWKIKDLSISKNQIVMLGADGCIFGLGDNSLGEMGLCHTDCVTKPQPLVFFYNLNQGFSKQLYQSLSHPVEKNCIASKKSSNDKNCNSNSNPNSNSNSNRSNNNNSNNNNKSSNNNNCNDRRPNSNNNSNNKYSNDNNNDKYSNGNNNGNNNNNNNNSNEDRYPNNFDDDGCGRFEDNPSQYVENWKKRRLAQLPKKYVANGKTHKN